MTKTKETYEVADKEEVFRCLDWHSRYENNPYHHTGLTWFASQVQQSMQIDPKEARSITLEWMKTKRERARNK